MKKIKILCAALLTIGLFTACKGASGGDNNSGKDPDVKPSNEEAISVYKNFIGTKWKNWKHNNSFEYPDIIEFSDDTVKFDYVSYPLNLNNDIEFEKGEWGENYLILSNEYFKYRICFFSETFPIHVSPIGDDGDSTHIYILNMEDTSGYQDTYACISTNAQGGGSSNGENETSVEGNYSFNATNGTEMSGSLTLSNGEWNYSGSNKPAATSGTYTVNGSKITVNWTANGLSLNETFTVTKNGNSVTWKSENEYTSTFLTMLFKVSATKLEVTFDYTE